MLALFAGLNLYWRIGLIAGVVLLFGAAIWYVHHSIYAAGYNEAEMKYKPQVEKLQQDLKQSQEDLDSAAKINKTFSEENARIAALLRDQSLAISKIEAAKIEAQNEARAALARIAANQKRYTAELARLTAIVNGPPMTEGDSEEADSILRSILRDRMSVSPRAAEAGGDRAAPARGNGQGPGGAAVHQQGRSAGVSTAYILGLENGQQSPGGGSGSTRLASAR